jgi:hypothetical protein
VLESSGGFSEADGNRLKLSVSIRRLFEMKMFTAGGVYVIIRCHNVSLVPSLALLFAFPFLGK